MTKHRGRFRSGRPYGGTTRPLATPPTSYQRRTSGPQHGGYHGNFQPLTPLQQLVKDIDDVYVKHLLREDAWPDPKTIKTIIEGALDIVVESRKVEQVIEGDANCE